MEIFKVKHEHGVFGQISFETMTTYQNSLVLEGMCPFCKVKLMILETLRSDIGKRNRRLVGQCGKCGKGFIAE